MLVSCDLGLDAGVTFFSLTFMALTSLTTVDLLVNERGLVVKEVLGGYYRPFSYYISKGMCSDYALFLQSCLCLPVMQSHESFKRGTDKGNPSHGASYESSSVLGVIYVQLLAEHCIVIGSGAFPFSCF